MARKITDKKRRKDELDPTNDEFITRTVSVFDWLYDRRRPLLVGAGLALGVAVMVIVVDYVVQGQREASSKLMADGLDAVMAPVVPSDDDGIPAAPEEDILYFDNAKARSTEALRRFEDTAEKEGSSIIGNVGQAGLGVARADLGEHTKARENFEVVLGAGGELLDWIGFDVEENIGYSLEAEGKLAEARKHFGQLAAKASGIEVQRARYHEARIAQKMSDKEQATELLKDIVGEFENNADLDRKHYVFVQTRERLLALDPKAEVPDVPRGQMDPQTLQRMIQMQMRQGGGAL